MNELGRPEDLPADHRAALAAHSLVTLWPSLRAVLPPGVPTRQALALRHAETPAAAARR